MTYAYTSFKKKHNFKCKQNGLLQQIVDLGSRDSACCKIDQFLL